MLTRSAFTLIELMIATAIALLLLLGTIELFRSTADTMQETRSTLTISANLEQVAALLRQDLDNIPETLATKPARMLNNPDEDIPDTGGYLEITEGFPADAPNYPYDACNGTVGDVDDMIAFTTKANIYAPYRGIIKTDNEGPEIIAERPQAEILWFMRGTSLYRRVRLIDDQNGAKGGLSPAELADRKYRFGHYGTFPYPLYPNNIYSGSPNDDENTRAWQHYWLRLPTLEETLGDSWNGKYDWTATYGVPPKTVPVDLWKTRCPGTGLDSKSGSLSAFVTNPRSPRAGEDVVLTNVVKFDVKIYDRDLGQYIDLPAGTNSALPRVFDSWKKGGDYYNNTVAPGDERYPPYDKALDGIQIQIRCFDPQSKSIRQITVVHSFVPR